MNIEERILAILEEVLHEDKSLFLVDLLVKGNPGNQRVIALVDSDQSFDIDKCAEISRKVSRQVEELDLIPGKWVMEVSSPGLDMPLKLMRQYRKNVGRNLKVETLDGSVIKGKLKQAEEDEVTLEIDGEEQHFEIQEIKQAKVEVSFN